MNATRNRFRFLTDYNEQPVEETTTEFVIPEDLSDLTDAQLSELHDQAVEHFQTIYNDGNVSEDDFIALAALTEGIEGLNAELAQRNEAAEERAHRAAELAARALPTELSAQTEDGEEEVVDEEDGEDEEDEEDEDDESAAQTVTAAAPRRETRIAVSRSNSRHLSPAQREPKTMKDVAFASADVAPFTAGQGVDWDGIARIVDKRLEGYNHNAFAMAANQKKVLQSRNSVAMFRRPIDPDLVINSSDPGHVEAVIARAVDESRLSGGSLVAAGGWCAPSETLYDLVELESRDGLFSLPTIGMARGGIRRTLGPTFSDIYNGALGFSYTEEQDEAGNYGVDANGVGNNTEGDKPCITIDCPDFEEFRLRADGICLRAGLLMARGYPELIARVTRGTLTAHEHRMAGKRIAAVVAGSTAVTMPATNGGALVPVLESFEKQLEHMKYTHRLGRGTTVEAIFPYWVRGVFRSDLARRLGVDLINVPNSRLDAHLRELGANVQFVYNWQDLTGTPGSFTAWPSTVKFLMYPAGTWIMGQSDILTLDTLYDSTLLGQNDYTALFTEEGWVVVKMSHDSRVVEVPLCADGATAAGVDFNCAGIAPAPVAP